MAYQPSSNINDGGFPKSITGVCGSEQLLNDKFQTMCKDASVQMFDIDMLPFVSYNIKYTNSPTVSNPSGSSYSYKMEPMYNVVPGEPPKQSTTCTIGQYSDYLSVSDIALNKKLCPENGHGLKSSCPACDKAYMNLFEDNTYGDYCKCYG